MRTNIDLDDALILQIRKATGLATKKAIVDAALRYYAAALEEHPGEPTRDLGESMRASERARVQRLSPAARVEEALALGEEQLRLAAEHSGTSIAKAREQHDREKDRTRRRGR